MSGQGHRQSVGSTRKTIILKVLAVKVNYVSFSPLFPWQDREVPYHYRYAFRELKPTYGFLYALNSNFESVQVVFPVAGDPATAILSNYER